MRALLVCLMIGLLAGCGGGGGGNGGGGGGGTSPPPQTGPSGLAYSAPPPFFVGQAITPLTPTVTGEVTSYTALQVLPAGLSLNPTTGVISGTPSTATAQANYTVNAQNAVGGTTATVTIVVNAQPSLSYSSPAYAFTANVTAQAIIPKQMLGSAVTWSVNPALPAGLTLDPSSGVIAGTPTAAFATNIYTVTATFSGGSVAAALTISVAAAPLLDLGHANQVVEIRTNATSVLSLDSAGHWILQDYISGTALANGDGACAPPNCPSLSSSSPTPVPVDMAGGVMMDNSAAGLEIRALSDGHVITTVPGTFSWYALASDGSYVATATTTALAAWSTTSGQAIFSHEGNYSTATAFVTPSAILVAKGPAGQSMIETVALPAGTSSTGPAFQGAFQAWFTDGSAFLTSLANAVWTYSSASVQQDLTQIAKIGQLGGEGQWLWNYQTGALGGVSIYKVGSSASAAFSAGASTFIPSMQTLALANVDTSTLTVVDLSGSTPTSANYTLPANSPYSVSAYGAASATAWLVGNGGGVVIDGSSLSTQPRYLTLGTASSIAGGSAYFAVATAAGEILYFDTTTNAQVGTINFPSSQLSASATGAVLATTTNSRSATGSLNVYSLPSGSVTNSFPYTYNSPSGPSPGDVWLSGSGTYLVEQLFQMETTGCNWEVVPVAGGAPLYCDTTNATQVVQVSPDGTLIAAVTGYLSVAAGVITGANTSIYQNGTLTTAVPGLAVGWLDDGHLLAQIYDNYLPVPNYLSSAIYDPQGNVLSTPALPHFAGAPPNVPWIRLTATPDSTVYVPGLNEVLSLMTGQPTWASGDSTTGIAAIAGTQVIFVSGSSVLAQPYQ